MDFTLKKYSQLLDALDEHIKNSGKQPGGSRAQIILRHDVDLRPDRSLQVAGIEKAKGWRAVYYFRAVPESWDEDIIRKIAAMGHEIGYHYESLTTCSGNINLAWEDFQTNLRRLSEVVGKPISSICMHGSPRSPWDSRDIWKTYDYRSVGVEFEPYLDTDWSRTFYLTDTGRRWDGWKESVRDKIPQWQDKWAAEGLVFHSTDDIIRAISAASRRSTGTTKALSDSTKSANFQSNNSQTDGIGTQNTGTASPQSTNTQSTGTAKALSYSTGTAKAQTGFTQSANFQNAPHGTGTKTATPPLPTQIMITTHPQRWMPLGPDYIREFILQNLKNIVKRAINLRRRQS